MDPDELFVQGAAQNRAKVVCATCPVRTECLADALDNRVEYGVWGGMTERERRALLRKRPEVRSWRQVLEEKRDAYLERTGGVLMIPEPSQILPRPRESAELADMVDMPDMAQMAEVQDVMLAEPEPVAAC
jgi:WhiB family redox-sensing transcriptional regulator